MDVTPIAVYFGSGTCNDRREDKNAQHIASANISPAAALANLCPLSSIIAPKCRVMSREEFEQGVAQGKVVYAVNGACKSNKRGMIVTAGMGIGLARDRNLVGFLTELYEDPGIEPKAMRRRVERATLQIMGDHLTAGKFDEQTTSKVYVPGQKDYTITGTDGVAVPFEIFTMVPTTQVNDDGDFAVALVGAFMFVN